MCFLSPYLVKKQKYDRSQSPKKRDAFFTFKNVSKEISYQKTNKSFAFVSKTKSIQFLTMFTRHCFCSNKQLQEALAAKPNRFHRGNGADCSTDTSEHAVYKRAGSVIHTASLFLIASSIISHKKFIVKSKMISSSIPARSSQTKTKSIKTTTHHKKKGSQGLSGGSGRGVWDGNIDVKRKERQPKTIVGLELSETSSRLWRLSSRILQAKFCPVPPFGQSRLLLHLNPNKKGNEKAHADRRVPFRWVHPTILNLYLI